MTAGSSSIFFNAWEIGKCVYEPHYQTFNFKLTSDVRIKPAFTDREVVFDLSHDGHALVTRWSRSTSSFYALIGQNLTGEFMR